jgi:hypothetical protein
VQISFRGRDAVRALFVSVLAAIALGTSIPNLYYTVYPMYGGFDFVLDENNGVVVANPSAEKAGMRVGDRVNYAAMPLNDHYQERFPLIGRTVTFRLQRGAAERVVTLTASYDRKRWIWPLWSLVIRRIAALVLIIAGSALVFVRPVPLSRAFFFYVIGSTHSTPYFYSFLPTAGYFAVMTASDALGAAGPAAFLWIALNLRSKRPGRWTTIMPIVVFTALFLTAVIPDARLMLLGVPAGPLFYLNGNLLNFCYAAGAVMLLLTALRSAEPRAQRIAAGFLAFAGGTMVLLALTAFIPFDWQNATFAARIAFKNANESALVVVMLASLGAAYTVIRMRVVDTGLVTSRVLWYGLLSFAVLAALAVVNWAYAAQLARYAFAIPFEVVAAVAVGYWFSGFRDVAQALVLSTVDAENAATQGRIRDERDALARALGLAERTRQRGLIAEIRARCAFSSWVWGDDEAFHAHVAGLRQALLGRAIPDLSAFLAAADGMQSLDRRVLPEWNARAELMLCAETPDAVAAQRHARSAAAAANLSQLPWLAILSCVAVAETVPAERKNMLEAAHHVAASQGWLEIGKAIRSLQSDEDDAGLLQPFVLVRLRRVRPAKPPLGVSFFTGTVSAYGERVGLGDKEMELLFTVALERAGIRDEDLMDRLWPDADGDAARNAFKVCLHRVRKHIGDPRAVSRSGKLYALPAWADVDLWKFRDAVKERRIGDLYRLYTLLCAGAQERAKTGLWFQPFELLLARASDEAERILAAQRETVLFSAPPRTRA